MASGADKNPMEWLQNIASHGIRTPGDENMKKTADPLAPVEPLAPGDAPQLTGREKQRQTEMESWQRWATDKNSQDFKFLLDSYKPFIFGLPLSRRYLETGQLPKSAIEADLIQHFHRALETYDPNKGAQLSTHVGNHLQHTGRFLRTYSNIGKIPEPRARQIGMYQDRESFLSEVLGRQPSTSELADDLGVDQKEVELLRRELRKDIPTGSMEDIVAETPRAMEQMMFLHMELNPEQQVVLEHTYGMFGRQAVDTNEDLARVLNITPQKVRAIKRQIAKRFEKRYG